MDVSVANEENDKRLLRWQMAIFAVTWLAYAAFYLTRKNYAIAQPGFMAEFGWSKSDVGVVITAYLSAYAVGQFSNGVLADRVGSRRMLAVGFGLTILMSVALGWAGTIAAFAFLYGANGYAQSTGWPAVTKAMAHWFPVSLRGRIMGWWGTNYPVGDAVATGFAAFVLAGWGWRSVFWVPAVLSLLVAVLVLVVLRDRPTEVGLAPVAAETVEQSRRATKLGGSLVALRDRRVLTLGLAYFCLKFVRYTLIFWIGVYLVEQQGFDAAEAGYIQVSFPLAGVAGTILSGWMSDRLFDARRAPPAVLLLVGLIVALLLFETLPGDAVVLSGALAVIGVLLYGPDMLVAGTAAMDFGTPSAAATVAGFVNGMGSVGAALSGVVVAWVADAWGWAAVFHLLVVMVACCAVVMASMWRVRAAG